MITTGKAKVSSVNKGKGHVRLGIQWWNKNKGDFVSSYATLLVFGTNLPQFGKGDKILVKEAIFRMEDSNKWEMLDPKDPSTKRAASFPLMTANDDKVEITEKGDPTGGSNNPKAVPF